MKRWDETQWELNHNGEDSLASVERCYKGEKPYSLRIDSGEFGTYATEQAAKTAAEDGRGPWQITKPSWIVSQWCLFDGEEWLGTVEHKYRGARQWGAGLPRNADPGDDEGDIGRYRTADEAKAAIEAWWAQHRKAAH